jgi:hypothetical protein
MGRLEDGRRRRSYRYFVAALLLAMLVLVTGCASDNFPVVRVVNHTSVAVDVQLVPVDGSDGSVILKDLKPGGEVGYSRIASGCSAVQLVAKDPQGLVIARSPSPVCNPSTWVIEMAGASPSPS